MKELRVRTSTNELKFSFTGEAAQIIFASLQGYIKPGVATKPKTSAYFVTEDLVTENIVTGRSFNVKLWFYKGDKVICEA